MNQISKAEYLRLPEQLYILLTDPDTGEPKFGSQRVERALSMAVVWELLNSGAFITDGNRITAVNNVMFNESYARRAALAATGLVPIDGRELGWVVASNLHPIQKAIAEDMLAMHLLTEEVRTRFVFFHQRVLSEIAEARSEATELAASLVQAARNLWDANYDAELAQTHPRLLARLVILDNYQLLMPLIGGAAYASAVPYLSGIRTHLHAIVQDTQVSKPTPPRDNNYFSNDSGDCHVYDSGADFWIFSSDDHHHDGHDGSDGYDSGGDSSGGSDGGGGGDCGGCGGCGG